MTTRISDTTTPTCTAGLAWHVHHNQLFEWCHDIEERRQYIRDQKPPEEIAVRLHRLAFIRTPTPLGDPTLRTAYEQARTAYEQAWIAYCASILPDALEAAHRAECPDCPWDGKTLFPARQEAL